MTNVTIYIAGFDESTERFLCTVDDSEDEQGYGLWYDEYMHIAIVQCIAPQLFEKFIHHADELIGSSFTLKKA